MTDVRQVWSGAAAIIMEENKLLMVKTKRTSSWSVPSGGIENGESPEQACIRETGEETGFCVEIRKPLHIKKAVIKHYDVTTHYFLCKVVSGEIRFQDPDEEIEAIAWKSKSEIMGLSHQYPEDIDILLSFFDRRPAEINE